MQQVDPDPRHDEMEVPGRNQPIHRGYSSRNTLLYIVSFLFAYFDNIITLLFKFLVVLHGLTRIRRILLSSQYVKVNIYKLYKIVISGTSAI